MINKLKFLGAARNVTGSRHLLQTREANILVDCGLYQERCFQNRNWGKFPFPPKDIDAVLLTHAHLDHCGYLPKLVQEGFRGKIYCTPATADLTRLILLDSAHIYEEDALKKKLRHRKEGREGKPYPEVPLYTVKEAEACCKLFIPVEYNSCVMIAKNIHACFYNAGHILGSAIIEVRFPGDDKECKVLFTGDMGRPNTPIIKDPDMFKEADYILIESTYGDKTHENVVDIHEKMGKAINMAYEKGANVLIPCFALERAQAVLYHLNKLYLNNALPSIPIFIDSPMASKVTEVFKKNINLYDTSMLRLVNGDFSPFTLPNLKMVSSLSESEKIQNHKGPVIIIASSGMCTGGRIKSHLIRNIDKNPRCTIMFVGYQASGTLGRQILDGEPEVRIYGENYHVNADVVRIPGFSAHADRYELLDWLKNFQKPPKGIFIVHGESETVSKFSSFLKENTKWNVLTPQYGEEIPLDFFIQT